jgi:hypothetical protein
MKDGGFDLAKKQILGFRHRSRERLRNAGAASWGCLGGQTGPQIDGNGQKSKEKIEKKVDTSFQSIWAGILMNLWCQNGTMLEEKRKQN